MTRCMPSRSPACSSARPERCFNKGNRWTDANAAKAERAPDRTVEIGSTEFGRLVDELAADNRQGLLALRGELLLEHRGQIVLVR
jgi:hypothetical protein